MVMLTVYDLCVKEATVDFLQHYRLVDPTKIDSYARAFAVEDEDRKGAIYPRVSTNQ